MADINEEEVISTKFFGKSGHAKRFTNGGISSKSRLFANVFVATDENEMNREREDTRYDSKDLSAMATELSYLLKKGDVIAGLNKDDGTVELFVSKDKINLETDASRQVQSYQKDIIDYNDNENNTVYVFDYDKFIGFMGNNPQFSRDESLSKFMTSEIQKLWQNDKGNVSGGVGKHVLGGTIQDSPFSLSDRKGVNPSNLRGIGQISVIVVGDFDKDLRFEGLMVNSAGAERIIKEQEISKHQLRDIVVFHEAHHALDDTNYLKYNGNVLGELYQRSRMEKKADLGAVKMILERHDDLKVAKFWSGLRANFAYEAARTSAFKKAALEGRIPGVFDSKSTRVLISEEKIEEEILKAKGKVGKIETTFAQLQQNAETIEALADVGMVTAYNTTPILDRFIGELEKDGKFREKIKDMKNTEFNQFVDKYLDKHDIGVERFGAQVLDMASVALDSDDYGNIIMVSPKNKDVLEVFSNKERKDAEMGVTDDENYDFQLNVNGKIVKSVNRYIQSGVDGFFFDSKKAKPMSDKKYEALLSSLNAMYRDVEREMAKNGGNETEAFSKVATEKKNRLRKGKWRYKHDMLELIDRTVSNYQKGSKAKIDAGIEIRKAIAEIDDYKVYETGDKLVVSHIKNQMSKLDVAEKILKKSLSNSGKIMLPKDREREAKELGVVFNEIIMHEKLSQRYSSKILDDGKAKNLIGNSKIISSKVTVKAGGHFPSWMEDFLIAQNEGFPAWKAENLVARIDEKRRLLASQVYENKDLLAKVSEHDDRFSDRITRIQMHGAGYNSEVSTVQVANDVEKSLVVKGAKENEGGLSPKGLLSSEKTSLRGSMNFKMMDRGGRI